jgi:hypothetical protein
MGTYNGTWFLGPNCTGQAYTRNIPAIGRVQGYVFTMNPSHSVKIYYVAPLSELENNPGIVSGGDPGGSCSNTGGPTFGGYVKIFPNDPEITGVSKTSFPAPLLLGQP